MFHVSLTGLAPHENAAAAVTVVGERKSSSRGPESGLHAGVDASGDSSSSRLTTEVELNPKFDYEASFYIVAHED